MKCTTENSVMTLELEAGETPQRHLLQAAIQKATEDGLWSVYVVLRPEIYNGHFDDVLELGFTVAGSESRNAQTFLKLKRHIRTSGEAGGSTAIPTPQLAPTREEVEAIKDMKQSLSLATLTPERLGELAAMGKQDAPEPPPDPVIDQMREEIARLEAAQKADGIDSGTF